jgi:hypothetical protein
MSKVPVALRRQVIERANNCCEYCLLSQEDQFPYEIEHIIATKHGGRDVLNNLAWSCLECNRNKGSDIASNDPRTGDLTRLFNPRTQDWYEHFQVNLTTARIEGLTAEGRVTVFLLKMNSYEQIEFRQLCIELGNYPCTPALAS